MEGARIKSRISCFMSNFRRWDFHANHSTIGVKNCEFKILWIEEEACNLFYEKVTSEILWVGLSSTSCYVEYLKKFASLDVFCKLSPPLHAFLDSNSISRKLKGWCNLIESATQISAAVSSKCQPSAREMFEKVSSLGKNKLFKSKGPLCCSLSYWKTASKTQILYWPKGERSQV